MIVGIDASRNRSGGAIIHIKGILTGFVFDLSDISQVHLWSYRALLDDIPDFTWLVKHCSSALDGNIFRQIIWQRFALPKELAENKCSVLLSTDAGTVCRFSPSVVMSRDMLSYEPGMMKLFRLISKDRLRLLLLKFMQNSSLRAAHTSIFLTNYASKIIQGSCGELLNTRIIPHGVSTIFNDVKGALADNLKLKKSIKITYVSNVSPYKNQIYVVSAVNELIKKGYRIKLDLIGGGKKKYVKKVNKYIIDTVDLFDSIKIYPKLSHEDLVEKLSGSDIFLFASSCENMPNTLVEGMSTGLPIVCSNKGPMPEVLKDGGLYFDPTNVNSIVGSLVKIIEDDALRINLSRKSYVLSGQYNWARCSQETFKLLADVVNRG